MQQDQHREGFKTPPPPSHKPAVGERELLTGLLSKQARFRLVVDGHVGVKEIERLIAKLELDKEILADSDDAPEAETATVPTVEIRPLRSLVRGA